jgi:hypothetical protein
MKRAILSILFLTSIAHAYLTPAAPVPITQGGTGQKTQQAAINALLPAQSGNNGRVLSTDGTNPAWVYSGLLPALTDYTNFVDQGIVLINGSDNAYYPSAVYDAYSFGVPSGPTFKMWFGNGSNAIFNSTSSDGRTWSSPVAVTGLSSDGYHNQVVYDVGCFGAPSCNPSIGIHYKIWYWRSTQGTCLPAFWYAESVDGLTWINNQAITQDPTAQLCDCVGGHWNGATYGPAKVFFQKFTKNMNGYPFDYSYVMYYDVSTGTKEATALAYSTDGKYWHVYGSDPVIPYSGSGWDANYSTYVGFLKDDAGIHAYFSGGVSGANEGIGYATSLDSVNFTKLDTNPLFTITGAPSYRNARTYTPNIVDNRSHTIFMYYSALSSAPGSKKQIGLATLNY